MFASKWRVLIVTSVQFEKSKLKQMNNKSHRLSILTIDHPLLSHGTCTPSPNVNVSFYTNVMKNLFIKSCLGMENHERWRKNNNKRRALRFYMPVAYTHRQNEKRKKPNPPAAGKKCWTQTLNRIYQSCVLPINLLKFNKNGIGFARNYSNAVHKIWNIKVVCSIYGSGLSHNVYECIVRAHRVAALIT